MTAVSGMLVMVLVLSRRVRFRFFFSFRLHHRDFDLVPEGGAACRYMRGDEATSEAGQAHAAAPSVSGGGRR